MKKNSKIEEDAMVAGGDAGAGEVVAPAAPAADIAGTMNIGIQTSDVLGKNCDHKKDGYMGKNCNHIPKKLHLSTDGSIRKKKRTPYEKGMKVLSEAELNRSTIMKIHDVSDKTIANFIETKFDLLRNEGVYSIQAIIYYPPTQSIFIKFEAIDQNDKLSTRYVNADFDGRKFKPMNRKVFNTQQALQEYKKILSMPGNNTNNVGSDSMQLWVIWGAV